MKMVCFLLSLALTGGEQSLAQYQESLDSKVDRAFDWTMPLTIQRLPNFLNYSGSKLHPIVRLRAGFHPNARGRFKPQVTSSTFEDLWYHEGDALGCRHDTNLQIEPGKLGALVIRSGMDNQDSPAIADALVRLTLELQILSTPVSAVMIPSYLYDSVSDQLARFNFRTNTTMDVGCQLNIHLISYPVGKSAYYYFQKSTP